MTNVRQPPFPAILTPKSTCFREWPRVPDLKAPSPANDHRSRARPRRRATIRLDGPQLLQPLHRALRQFRQVAAFGGAQRVAGGGIDDAQHAQR